MAAGKATDEPEGVRRRRGTVWRDGLSRLSLPIFTTVVSAVLIANFVTVRQVTQHLQRARDLQTKALIADEMSDGAVRLIVAAEYNTKALIRGAKRTSSDVTSRAVADFEASSAVVRAKLEAYYDDQTLADRWRRYTNAVVAFNDIGTLRPRPRHELSPADKEEIWMSQVQLKEEIRKGLRGLPVLAALERLDITKLENRGERFVYLTNYGLVGDRLIAQGAELTREALD
jgi:hypothetical protein